MPNNSTVWSCGGGTQSAAIAALIVRGELPKPDLAVIADTGREASETWRYYEDTLAPQLDNVGVDLVRLPHTFDGSPGWNTVDLYGGANRDSVLMPMFTSTGQVPKYCSNEWKSRPVDRYVRAQGLECGSIWIGFSIDELHRMRANDPEAKWNHVYPLIDRRMTRADCLSLVERMGWDCPPRSSCWMCPYRSDTEWRRLKNVDPGDFLRAVKLEQDVQKIDPDLWLHRSAVPLHAVNFGESQGDMFECASGMCFT